MHTRSSQHRKVIGRIAGQMVSVIYTLLKKDQESLNKLHPGTQAPGPVLYDPEVHRRHREGHYRAPCREKGSIDSSSFLHINSSFPSFHKSSFSQLRRIISTLLSWVLSSSITQKSRKKALWGETMDTVRNVNNVSIEDVFSRSLRLNGKRRIRLSNVSDVSRGRGLLIHRLRCVRRYCLAHARLRSLLPIKVISRFSKTTDQLRKVQQLYLVNTISIYDGYKQINTKCNFPI
jgi:hypothetical protein